MTTYLPVRETAARLGIADMNVRMMLRVAKGAIRTQDTKPKLVCWEDVLAWRNDAPKRKAAMPWQIESRKHYEARMASRKDKAMIGSMSERSDR